MKYLSAIAILSLFVGCAATPPAPYAPQAPGDPEGPHGLWHGVHPGMMVYGSAAGGDTKYTTRGVPNPRDEAPDARLYRFVSQSWGGVDLTWMDSSSDMENNTRVQAFDFYSYANFMTPVQDFLRVYSRPGFYYNNINLKDARVGDVEPWTAGARVEGELEADLYKGKWAILSGYGSARFGGGWGSASVVGFGRDATWAWDWGYELGLRLQGGRVMFALSWLDRTNDFNGIDGYDNATYRFRGGNLSVGVRW